jgi:hypothetical protein
VIGMRPVLEESTVFIGEELWRLGVPSLFAGCQWHARIIRQTACDVDLTTKMRRKLWSWSRTPDWIHQMDDIQITCIDGGRSASVLLDGGPRSH